MTSKSSEDEVSASELVALNAEGTAFVLASEDVTNAIVSSDAAI